MIGVTRIHLDDLETLFGADSWDDACWGRTVYNNKNKI